MCVCVCVCVFVCVCVGGGGVVIGFDEFISTYSQPMRFKKKFFLNDAANILGH